LIETQVTASYVAQPRSDVSLVEVGDEAVLVAGWDLAMALNETARLIWERLDGQTTLGEVAANLAEQAGADPQSVLSDVAGFVERLGADGVLEGYVAPQPEGYDDIVVVAMEPVRKGSVLGDVELVGIDGTPMAMLPPQGSERVIVKWNPYCGFCSGIARTLSELHADLAGTGVDLLLVSFGDVSAKAEAAKSFAETSGIELPIAFGSSEFDPLVGVGTPSGYHVSSTGEVLAETAHGSIEVPALIADIAGVTLNEGTAEDGSTVKYLGRSDGLCAPDMEVTPGEWVTTRVYRIGDYHIGIRVDSEATGLVLDQVFAGARVQDERAGHSYMVALPGAKALLDAGGGEDAARDSLEHGDDTSGASRGLNLFVVQGAGVTVRSRNPARVIRALLARLDTDLDERPLASGQVRVVDQAVVMGDEAVLLPRSVNGFAPRLQPELARMGAALVDVERPVVDLDTGCLVVEPLRTKHNVELVQRLADSAPASALELPLLEPGRYPIRSWSTLRIGVNGVTPLSGAEAAAAMVSSVFKTGEPAQRVREVGEVFATGRLRGLGFWYRDEASFFTTLEAAMGWTHSEDTA